MKKPSWRNLWTIVIECHFLDDTSRLSLSAIVSFLACLCMSTNYNAKRRNMQVQVLQFLKMETCLLVCSKLPPIRRNPASSFPLPVFVPLIFRNSPPSPFLMQQQQQTTTNSPVNDIYLHNSIHLSVHFHRALATNRELGAFRTNS
jgi:hypothetical protein